MDNFCLVPHVRAWLKLGRVGCLRFAFLGHLLSRLVLEIGGILYTFVFAVFRASSMGRCIEPLVYFVFRNGIACPCLVYGSSLERCKLVVAWVRFQVALVVLRLGYITWHVLGVVVYKIGAFRMDKIGRMSSRKR